jgi:hypothetical protein
LSHFKYYKYDFSESTLLKRATIFRWLLTGLGHAAAVAPAILSLMGNEPLSCYCQIILNE